MARNYEKNFSKLNRLWLEKGAVKKEKRPKLSSIKTSDEISYWLPSIKNELDFFLKQTEVPCYTENKINECRKHILYLEAEYKAFVRKLHRLNTSVKVTPWTPRPYEKREKAGDEFSSKCDLTLHPTDTRTIHLAHINRLQTPVLIHDHLYQGCEESDSKLQADCCAYPTDTNNISGQFSLHRAEISTEGVEEASVCKNVSKHDTCTISQISKAPILKETSCKRLNVLGLDYSSSEEEN